MIDKNSMIDIYGPITRVHVKRLENRWTQLIGREAAKKISTEIRQYLPKNKKRIWYTDPKFDMNLLE